MTRFDATTPDERRKLFAEAITAHRERASAFCTFEVGETATSAEADDESGRDQGDEVSKEDESGEDVGDAGDAEDAEGIEAPPWVQFGDGVSAERSEDEARREAKRSGGVLNLDCTDAELDRLKDLLAEFPAFKIDELTRPEEAEGVNVRVSALADPNRVAQCVDRIFQTVYDRPETYRAWVTAV